MATIQLDFTNLCAAQDMIAIIQKSEIVQFKKQFCFQSILQIVRVSWTPVGLRLHIHFGVMTIRKESGFF